MTTTELKDAFSAIDWKSLSDEELIGFLDNLSEQKTCIERIVNARKHFKTHFPFEKKSVNC